MRVMKYRKNDSKTTVKEALKAASKTALQAAAVTVLIPALLLTGCSQESVNEGIDSAKNSEKVVNESGSEVNKQNEEVNVNTQKEAEASNAGEALGAEVSGEAENGQTPGEAETTAKADIVITDNESLAKAKEAVWEEYIAAMEADEVRKAEVKDRKMTFGEVTMKYGFQKKGKPDENGYPLYIALHGGGQSDTPDINDSQWSAMAIYYGNNVRNGIYINPRGVRDTWDTHFNPESYPLYDRLIENMIAYYNVDPNRVYLLGYSAGGDGVYAISARMTDRFAAANMSAGHPNGMSLLNLCDMPIQLQVGRMDTSYDRHKVTAEYGLYLDSLAAEYGEGHYEHNVFVHADYAHNFYDNNFAQQNVIADISAWLTDNECTTVKADTNSVNFVNRYTRVPFPTLVVWDLTVRGDQREVKSNYWLRADMTENTGLIVASYSKEDNSITIEKDGDGVDFDILLSDEMLDLFKPVTVNSPKGSVTVTVTPSVDTIRETTFERGDKTYQFAAVLNYNELFK